MSRVDDLVLGQIVALAAGLLFFGIEYLRFRRARSDRPLAGAIAEGARMWGFIVASELTVWLAFGSQEPFVRALIAVIGPLVAAILVNNAYASYQRAQIKK